MTIYKVADNIVSSLGLTTAACYEQVKQGVTGVRPVEELFGLQEPLAASLIDDDLLERAFAACTPACEAYTRLEKAAILSVTEALSHTDLDPADPRLLFVFSSTKGNVALLEEEACVKDDKRLQLWYSAGVIARHFGNKNRPIVVSNACVSGVAAQLVAKRLLQGGAYDRVIVVGADMLSRFIVSGFQSFKALSDTYCRPFDRERRGLNLGEAAATIIWAKRADSERSAGDLLLTDGAMHNDANHISGPSRTGEGAYRVLLDLMRGHTPDEIAFINAHGTATPYNDEMESIAITRAGLGEVPVNALKGALGHTLGAAGVVESILSLHALAEGIVLGTQGFEQLGVSHPLCITPHPTTTDRRHAIKMLSGFGGTNAGILFYLDEG